MPQKTLLSMSVSGNQAARKYNVCSAVTKNPLDCFFNIPTSTPPIPPVILDKVYVAMLFQQSDYIGCLDDVITLIDSQFPNNDVVYEKYVFTDTTGPDDIINFLNEFLIKYPTGQRCTISTYTFVLRLSSEFFLSKGENIPSFSLSASSETVKQLQNVLTLAPFDQYSVMSLFYIYKQYNVNKITVYYDPANPSQEFFTNYINNITIQSELLNVPLTIDTLIPGKTYTTLSNNSCIVLLGFVPGAPFVDGFIEQIQPLQSTYICLPGVNDEFRDVYGNIPALAIYPTPLNYTSTTEIVYKALTNKKGQQYFAFSFYDIIYKIIDMNNSKTPLTITNFIANNAFQKNNYLEAYINALVFDETINGAQFGKYNAVFTKNVIVNEDSELYLQHNSGGIQFLPDSYSSFRFIGIVPFFSSYTYYNENEYFKLYDTNDNLLRVGYDFTNCTYDNLKVNTGTKCEMKFLYEYTEDGWFKQFDIMYPDKNLQPLQVNATMSKTPLILYINASNN